MAKSEEGLYIAAWTVARVCRPSMDEDPDTRVLQWQAEATQTISALISCALMEPLADLLPEVGDKVFDLVWPWYYVDPSSLTQWLSAQIKASRWTLLDVLAGFVPVGTASDGSRSFETIGGISLEPIERLFGTERVLASLASEIDAAQLQQQNRFELEPTWQNRRLLMLSALKAERSRRRADGGGSLDARDR
jgi:hypothetical protein